MVEDEVRVLASIDDVRALSGVEKTALLHVYHQNGGQLYMRFLDGKPALEKAIWNLVKKCMLDHLPATNVRHEGRGNYTDAYGKSR